MTLRDREALLAGVADACGEVKVLVEGVALCDYMDEVRTRRAVERGLEIIGEAVARVLRHAPEAAACWSTDVRQVVAFRNRLAHEYDALDDAEVFRIAVEDVPVLLADITGSGGSSA